MTRRSALAAALRFVSLASLTMTAGCFDDEIVGSSTINGRYTLRTVNNAALPFMLRSNGATRRELVDDVLELYQGNTYARTAHVRVTQNGATTTETQTEAGSYSSAGTSVSFTTSARVGATVAMYSANTLTIILEGATYVFQK